MGGGSGEHILQTLPSVPICCMLHPTESSVLRGVGGLQREGCRGRDSRRVGKFEDVLPSLAMETGSVDPS
eukprot:10618368-Prorocentrum_lima.AAC.1